MHFPHSKCTLPCAERPTRGNRHRRSPAPTASYRSLLLRPRTQQAARPCSHAPAAPYDGPRGKYQTFLDLKTTQKTSRSKGLEFLDVRKQGQDVRMLNGDKQSDGATAMSATRESGNRGTETDGAACPGSRRTTRVSLSRLGCTNCRARLLDCIENGEPTGCLPRPLWEQRHSARGKLCIIKPAPIRSYQSSSIGLCTGGYYSQGRWARYCVRSIRPDPI
ncbi:uncharacterized protein UV8b_02510 [Ustilaginoidea virens]|uniref:Uncharacterized protein n=1 Tax=Ustilaginoidea virens TaxID=1159556 RepID=A0A8E5HNK8_USTVR|nr:uncharacterized protein UV8b_02510 [Ustilaginoidea virens]QUC18269.1 hypothetical protein UV8b_02510 [Ustilaginoidea virens]